MLRCTRVRRGRNGASSELAAPPVVTARSRCARAFVWSRPNASTVWTVLACLRRQWSANCRAVTVSNDDVSECELPCCDGEQLFFVYVGNDPKTEQTRATAGSIRHQCVENAQVTLRCGCRLRDTFFWGPLCVRLFHRHPYGDKRR